MKGKVKRFLCMFLAMIMLITMLPAIAFAATNVTVTVTNQLGVPVSSASVAITENSYGVSKTVASGLTNNEGTVTLTYDRRGGYTYRVVTKHDQYESNTRTINQYIFICPAAAGRICFLL